MKPSFARIGAAVVTAVVALSGVAWATGTLQTTAVDATATTYEVPDAGTVTLSVENQSLVLIDVTPSTGWAATIDAQTTREIEIEFTTEGRHVRFDAELEDGRIRTRTEERVPVETGTEIRTDVTSPTLVSTASTSTSTTSITQAETSVDVSGSDETFDVRGAGTVTLRVEGSTLTLVDASPSEGWTVSIDEQTRREIEIDFRRSGSRIRFNGELEDDRIRTRVEIREGTAPDGATSDDSNGSTSAATTAEVETFSVAGVASVTLRHDVDGLSLLTVAPLSGWTVDVEDADGDRIRIDFRSGESEVEFEARWDGSRLRYEIDRDDD